MDFNCNDLTAHQRYKLLLGCVLPRPIALVTTVNSSGSVNAAPFSFFNAMSDDPPVVALGVYSPDENRIKDTGSNIARTGEFVVNLVNEELAESMSVCSFEFPPDVSEIEEAGLVALRSSQVAAPRIAGAPVSMECRLISTVDLGNRRTIVVGKVVHFHIASEMFDPDNFYVKGDKLGLIARMHGADRYLRTTDIFRVLKPEQQKAAAGPAGRSRSRVLKMKAGTQ